MKRLMDKYIQNKELKLLMIDELGERQHFSRDLQDDILGVFKRPEQIFIGTM